MPTMHRIWDCIVAVTMILISILIGGVTAIMIAFPILLGIGRLIDLHGSKGTAIWCTAIGVFLLLQAAGFYDFYYRRRINLAGRAGVFHLIPRAIQRIRTGYELHGFIDAATGKPTTVQQPINAGLRGIIALLLIIISGGAFVFSATAKGDLSLLVMALGLIGFIAGLILLAQAVLAYAGFIRRKI